MLMDFIVVVTFLVFGFLVVFFSLLVPRLLAPSRPDQEKRSVYECGERPIGNAWIQFNIRFYVVALIFLTFDMALALLFPCAVAYGGWVEKGTGLYAFLSLLIFITTLLIGLSYVWAKGDFAWVKTIKK